MNLVLLIWLKFCKVGGGQNSKNNLGHPISMALSNLTGFSPPSTLLLSSTCLPSQVAGATGWGRCGRTASRRRGGARASPESRASSATPAPTDRGSPAGAATDVSSCKFRHGTYKVFLVVWQLDWVELDLGCSAINLGQYVSRYSSGPPAGGTPQI